MSNDNARTTSLIFLSGLASLTVGIWLGFGPVPALIILGVTLVMLALVASIGATQ